MAKVDARGFNAEESFLACTDQWNVNWTSLTQQRQVTIDIMVNLWRKGNSDCR